MTDSSDSARADQGLDASLPEPPGEPARPSTFSLEGRAAPALYLIGWVGTVMGSAVIAVSLLASGSVGAPWAMLAGLVVLGVGLVAAAGSQAVERSRRPDLPYRGPSPVLAFLAVIVLTLVGVLVVLAPASAALGLDVQSPVATTLSLAVTTLMYLVVVRLLVVGPGALSWAEMGLRAGWRDATRDLVAGALLAIPVLVVTLVLGALLAQFLEPAPGPLPEAGDAPALIANLLSAAILAPVGEELFFRGFTTTAWERVYGARSAIFRGAVFFAIAHVVTVTDVSFAVGVQRAVFSFVALLPVALALGWVFLGRRSLYAAIGLHAAFNGLQILLLFAAPGAA